MRHRCDLFRDVVKLLLSAALLSVLLSPATCQRPTLDFVRIGGPTSNSVTLTCEDDDGDPILNARFYNDGEFNATQSDGVHEVTLTPGEEGPWTCDRMNGEGGQSEELILLGMLRQLVSILINL